MTAHRGSLPNPRTRVLEEDNWQEAKLDGLMEDQTVCFSLDPGASVSVVPRSMVPDECLDGDSVTVLPFHGRDSLTLPTASVRMQIYDQGWMERIAVLETDRSNNTRDVLLSVSWKSEKGRLLFSMVNEGLEQVSQWLVTRSMAQEEAAEKAESDAIAAVEQPVLRTSGQNHVVVAPKAKRRHQSKRDWIEHEEFKRLS